MDSSADYLTLKQNAASGGRLRPGWSHPGGPHGHWKSLNLLHSHATGERQRGCRQCRPGPDQNHQILNPLYPALDPVLEFFPLAPRHCGLLPLHPPAPSLVCCALLGFGTTVIIRRQTCPHFYAFQHHLLFSHGFYTQYPAAACSHTHQQQT